MIITKKHYFKRFKRKYKLQIMSKKFAFKQWSSWVTYLNRQENIRLKIDNYTMIKMTNFKAQVFNELRL